MTSLFNRTAGALVAAACLAGLAPAQAQPSHPHEHAQHGTMALELDHGRRWATDAPLREGMERIRAAVAKASRADAPGGLTPAQAQALAASVDEGIAFMVQHCHLEPKADASLHILLGRLSGAAAAVKANPGAADGLPRLREALAMYPRYFAHPGWPADGAPPVPAHRD
jgi:hypothetical protein